MIAIAVTGESAFESAWRLGRASVTEIVTADPYLRTDVLLAALTRAHADGVLASLWRTANLSLPDPLVTVMRRALRSAHAPFTAGSLAELTKMHERSLRKYCTRHRLPSPQILVGWARLLLAAYYLDERGRTLKAIAELLGYPTPGALRKQVRRYTNRSTTELRREGALRTVAMLLQNGLVPATPPTTTGAPALFLVRPNGSKAHGGTPRLTNRERQSRDRLAT
ncbi:MAG: AraC family transcriptional regulator [Gemmatimonadota bacterium]